MVIYGQSKIDSIDDLIASNLTAVNANGSWLYAQFEAVTKYNNKLDEQLLALKPKMKFLDQNEVLYKQV